MAKRPNDILKGQVITAEWLNAAKNAALSALRVGPGLTKHVSGGVVTVGLTPRSPERYSLPNFAVLTGAGSAPGKFTAQPVTTEWTGSANTEFVGLYNGTDLPELTEANGFPAFTGEVVVQVFAGRDTSVSDGVFRPFFFHPIGIGTPFDVAAVSDGGSAGDNDDPATWTYTLTTLAGHELDTARDPTSDIYFQRPSVGYRTAAKVARIVYATAHPLALDSFVLLDCNEIDEGEECS